MPLALTLRFLNGRFHATRWGENPAADAYGEWPPSPWRLLRALAAAWFNGSATKGHCHAEDVLRSLLTKLAAAAPSFYLPPNSWRAGPLKHYHPTGSDWDVKMKAEQREKGAQRVVGRTLVEDHFIAIPPGEPVWWIWSGEEKLSGAERELLLRLCPRVSYFGRAESVCNIALAIEPAPAPNCEPLADQANRPAGARPVLVAAPDFRPEHVLESVDDMRNRRKRIVPDGARWTYYQPLPSRRLPAAPQLRGVPSDLRCVQFALGGRVWPTDRFVVSIAERFRGSALKRYAVLVTGNREARFTPKWLTAAQWSERLSGKDYTGKKLDGHRHAYYLPQLDAQGRITGLIVSLAAAAELAFSSEEVEALSAVETLYWGSGDYPLRVVPLPLDCPRPDALFGNSRVWESATPFVPPRHDRGRRGKPKPGENVMEQLRREISHRLGPDVAVDAKIETMSESGQPVRIWVSLHAPRKAGQRPQRRGWHCRIEFSDIVSGPLIFGHSAHFGLGQFRPVDD
jgi:CRISPR-associated protein Csb2